MEKAKRAEKVWFVHAILALVYVFVGAPMIAVSIIAGLYPLMGVFIAVTAYGAYGIIFYFLLYSRAKSAVKCIIAVEEKGLLSYAEISEEVGLRVNACKAVISKCVGKRYLTRYGIGVDSLVKV